MSTVASVINKARELLQDSPLPAAGPYRYSTATLLGYANEGMQRAITIRPDLVFGSYSTAWTDKAESDTFPFSSKYEALIADYIVFRANTLDGEETSAARAAGFIQLFEKALT